MDRASPLAAVVAESPVQLYGSFHLGEFELALPIAALQEVVAFPDAIAKVPMAPAYLLGLSTLRGLLMPILHLGSFLGLPDGADHSEARVAVIASGDMRLGVLFDGTGDILRVSTSQIAPFRHGSESPGLIEGAFHLDDRILQLLSADALSRLPGLPQVDLTQQALQQSVARRTRHKAISFQVAGRHMALPIAAIHEIVRLPALEHSVLGDSRCRGWLQLRGRPVPVVDFATFLGLESGNKKAADGSDSEDLRRVMVLRQDDSYLGLLVDEVDGIVTYFDAQLLPMPAIHGQTGLFAGCISGRDTATDDLTLVSAPALLAEPYMAQLTKGHHDLYLVTEHEVRDVQTTRQQARETWVTFQLDRLMGLRIEQLCEVIDYDTALVRPPGAQPYIRGVLNLRRTLITVVDLRRLYGMNEAQDLAASKILIVEHNGCKYGLVVDAVQNILSIKRAEKLRVPILVANQLDTELRQDLREIVELPNQTTVMLLDSVPLVQRLTGNGGGLKTVEALPEPLVGHA